MLMLSPSELIEHLGLEKHPEGGYFYRTFYSAKVVQTEDQGERKQLSSIFYLLTKDSHLSYFTRNKSDLIIYYHMGNPLKIVFLDQDGKLSHKVLGPDLKAGQYLQIACPANTCKAYDLEAGTYCLIGEAVAPGYEEQDMTMPSFAELKALYPENINQLKPYIIP